MGSILAWIAAVGGVAATAGTWTGPLRDRWRLHAETLRTDRSRREAALHRQRFEELWAWAHAYRPDDPDQARAWRWYDWWIGDPPGVAPGSHAADADDAYRAYVEWLEACYGPDRRWGPDRTRTWPRLPAGEPPLSWRDDDGEPPAR